MCLRITITSKNIIWLLNLFYRFLRHLARTFYRLIYLSLRIQPNSCLIATQANHCRADAEDNVRNNLQNSAIPDNCPKGNRCVDNMIRYNIEPHHAKQINDSHACKISLHKRAEADFLRLAYQRTIHPRLHNEAKQITKGRLRNIARAAAGRKNRNTHESHHYIGANSNRSQTRSQEQTCQQRK